MRKGLAGGFHTPMSSLWIQGLRPGCIMRRGRTTARDAWCQQAMRSRIEPIKKVARSLRKHRQLILNWFVAKKKYNAGIVEGLNAMVKLRFRKAFGFRTFEAIEVALYHQLGQLPQPEVAHRFC